MNRSFLALLISISCLGSCRGGSAPSGGDGGACGVGDCATGAHCASQKGGCAQSCTCTAPGRWTCGGCDGGAGNGGDGNAETDGASGDTAVGDGAPDGGDLDSSAAEAGEPSDEAGSGSCRVPDVHLTTWSDKWRPPQEGFGRVSDDRDGTLTIEIDGSDPLVLSWHGPLSAFLVGDRVSLHRELDRLDVVGPNANLIAVSVGPNGVDDTPWPDTPRGFSPDVQGLDYMTDCAAPSACRADGTISVALAVAKRAGGTSIVRAGETLTVGDWTVANDGLVEVMPCGGNDGGKSGSYWLLGPGVPP